MKITYFGTTMLLFDDGNCQLMFDCHVTRPSLISFAFGRIKTNTAVADKVIRDFHIDRLKAVFASHSHHDHAMDIPYFALSCNADVYGSVSTLNIALGGGVGKESLHCYDDSMKYTIGEYKVRVIPSLHSIARWYNNDRCVVTVSCFAKTLITSSGSVR